jgi:tRNA(His) 5'-end guanylyltransferase
MGENNYADGKIAYLKFGEKWPCFDCRCFSIPEHEISNYYWWRLLDCKRNSISMNAQAKFSHKELQGKNCEEMQEMLFSKHGINWNNIPQGQKSGYVSYRKKETKVVYARGPADEHNGRTCERNAWLLVPSPKTKSELDEVIISVLKKQE